MPQNRNQSTPPIGRRPDARRRWYLRIPLKLLIFAGIAFAVLYPHPARLARHLHRLRQLDAVIDPDAPHVAALETMLLEWAAATDPEMNLDQLRSDSHRAQRLVERFIYEKVQYAWDWELWGVVDYFPSIEEIFEKAGDGPLREDCDGRALLAASLMRRFGFEATLAADLRHMWVETPQGAFMSPGETKTIAFDEHGSHISYGTLLANLPSSLTFGIAVFPLMREMILLLAAWVLMLDRRTTPARAILGLMLLVQGLLFLRLSYPVSRGAAVEMIAWSAWVGLLHIAAGFVVLLRPAPTPTAARPLREAWR